MAKFKPGDRVAIKTEFYGAPYDDYNAGEGVVVSKGCGPACKCGDYYEVMHDLDSRPDITWETATREHTTPYSEDELTKID